jgi:hypothetical protein
VISGARQASRNRHRHADGSAAPDGLTVLRRLHLDRWIDGSAHAWIGRKANIGAAQPDSKLTFDRLV